ncbi:hypothetical protein AB1L30_00975, partial [Bremerella sp. JC817]|uniref:hypothetical protein n=1 Tax=Bremerella sp. JC817 TaxID=3231756 RepID=UPI00345A34D0
PYTFTYSPSGNLQGCYAGNTTTCTIPAGAGGGTGVGPNGFNRQNFRTLAVPVERYLFAARGNYEVSDDVEAYFEGTFNRTTSSRIIEPFPLESGGANGVFPSGGGFNVDNGQILL